MNSGMPTDIPDILSISFDRTHSSVEELTLPRLKSMGFLFHRPQHSELRLTRSLGELLLQLFSTGLKFRMPYGIVRISGY